MNTIRVQPLEYSKKGDLNMKKLLLCIVMTLLLCLCACGEKDPVPTHSKLPPKTNASTQATQATDPTQPTIPSQPTDPTKPTQPADPTEPTQPADPTEPDDCSRGHDFADDPDLCARCGLDYFSATLQFKLSDSREFYIVTGIGTCDRTEISIPETHWNKPVKEIGEGAFALLNYTGEAQRRCEKITKVILPESVTEIGASAFANCRSLTEVNIPAGVTVIKASTFVGCEKLAQIHLLEGLISVEEAAFNGCYSMEQIDLPHGLEFIGNLAFAGCRNLKTLEIPDSVTEIGSEAFSGCKSLESLTVPGSIGVIPEAAFSGTSLKNVQIGHGVTTIENKAFQGADFETLVLPETVTKIGYRAFRGCEALKNLVLPSGLKDIADEVFYGCDSLIYNVYENMNYLGNAENPYMVLVIGVDEEITDLIVHDKTQLIVSKHTAGKNFNEECLLPNLRTLHIGKNVEYIEQGVFLSTTLLTDIQVSPENKTLHSQNNCIIETESKELIIACKTSTIPDDGSVTRIGARAFAFQQERKLLIIPDAITHIESNAFIFCPNLEALIIGSGVEIIEHDQLIACDNFARIYYMGTQEEWEKIDIAGRKSTGGVSFGSNRKLLEATVYFYSEEKPTEPGNYWHYVDGVPTPWET